MARALLAGLLYCGITFCFGAVFGAIREIYVVDHLGPVLSRVLEAPAMLAVSWTVAVRLVSWFNVPSHTLARVTMGGAGLACLLMVEALFAVYGLGQTFRGHLGEYMTAKGLVGLGIQLGFAAIPWLMAQRQGGANG
jgi:hypothetical protein